MFQVLDGFWADGRHQACDGQADGRHEACNRAEFGECSTTNLAIWFQLLKHASKECRLGRAETERIANNTPGLTPGRG